MIPKSGNRLSDRTMPDNRNVWCIYSQSAAHCGIPDNRLAWNEIMNSAVSGYDD
jgi:hypothetical protein